MARRVVVGEIAGAYGVKGWVKIHSYTEPAENILDYSPWRLAGDKCESREYKVIAGRRHGQAVVARLEGVETRDQAVGLRFQKISVSRDQFPQLERGCYYWVDLIGLKVLTCSGVEFGTVAEMMATGANDVMVVRGERERLVPFVLDEYVKEVRLDEGIMIVDWDPDF
ncbi:MAG TPA: ribosome maturation factor RimM [Methylococcaceae bacterium]|nr:ribosome maturation factor RimM [Methylococcaceae bacterium]